MTTPLKKPRPLTPKQERFVIEYAKDLNATQAARRAGYTGKYVDRYASELLKITRGVLEARTTQVLAKREASGIASLEQALKLCTALAFHDPRKLYTDHGSRKDISKLSRLQGMVVLGCDPETDFYKTIDRMPYLSMLLKHLGAFPTKVLPAPSTTRQRFDLSKLSDEELREHMRLRRKAMVQIEEQPS